MPFRGRRQVGFPQEVHDSIPTSVSEQPDTKAARVGEVAGCDRRGYARSRRTRMTQPATGFRPRLILSRPMSTSDGSDPHPRNIIAHSPQVDSREFVRSWGPVFFIVNLAPSTCTAGLDSRSRNIRCAYPFPLQSYEAPPPYCSRPPGAFSRPFDYPLASECNRPPKVNYFDQSAKVNCSRRVHV